MSDIEVEADLLLADSIVLSAQGSPEYAPITLALSTGDHATVSLAVPADDIRRMYADKPDHDDYWVNVRVEALHAHLRMPTVSGDDLDRLLGCHGSAEVLGVDGGPYQEARVFGQRVVCGLLEAANTIIRVLRYGYGQYWLQPIEEPSSIQNFLLERRVRWRVADGEWNPLWVERPCINLGVSSLGTADQYLSADDWSLLGRQIGAEDEPHTGFALIAEARHRFAVRDRQMAVIHLNSALEWTVQRFLEQKLTNVLPGKTLKTVLKQSHGRLLDDWVLPLTREMRIDLDDLEWQMVKRLQDLRAQAGHPAIGTAWAELSNHDFHQLAVHASRVVSKLLGVPMPKAPPLLTVTMAAGPGRRILETANQASKQ